jgi:hypothetical protein
MKKLTLFGLLGLVVLVAGCKSPVVTLYAQSLPVSLKFTWDPNAAPENVLRYSVAQDNGTPVTVPLTACTATTCTYTYTVSSWGAHSIYVVAVNQKLSTDPNSTQTSSIAQGTVAYSLAQAPNSPANKQVSQ